MGNVVSNLVNTNANPEYHPESVIKVAFLRLNNVNASTPADFVRFEFASSATTLDALKAINRGLAIARYCEPSSQQDLSCLIEDVKDENSPPLFVDKNSKFPFRDQGTYRVTFATVQ